MLKNVKGTDVLVEKKISHRGQADESSILSMQMEGNF